MKRNIVHCCCSECGKLGKLVKSCSCLGREQFKEKKLHLKKGFDAVWRFGGLEEILDKY